MDCEARDRELSEKLLVDSDFDRKGSSGVDESEDSSMTSASSRRALSALSKESALEKAILDWSACHPRRIMLWRQNTGAFVLGEPENQRFFRSGIAGQADFSGLVEGGRRVEIETKRHGKTPTENQIEFGRRIRELGGIYIVATSLDDVIDGLRKEGIAFR